MADTVCCVKDQFRKNSSVGSQGIKSYQKLRNQKKLIARLRRVLIILTRENLLMQQQIVNEQKEQRDCKEKLEVEILDWQTVVNLLLEEIRLLKRQLKPGGDRNAVVLIFGVRTDNSNGKDKDKGNALSDKKDPPADDKKQREVNDTSLTELGLDDLPEIKEYLDPVTQPEKNQPEDGINNGLSSEIKNCNQCAICSRSFSSPEILSKHLKYHDNGRSYECNICNRKFFTILQLDTHIMTVHLNFEQDDLDDDILPELNFDLPDLVEYLDSEPDPHTEHQEKEIDTHKCEVCFESFSNTEDLSIHEKSHMPLTPHECRVCSRRFSKNIQLDRHIKRIHLNLEEEDVKKNEMPHEEILPGLDLDVSPEIVEYVDSTLESRSNQQEKDQTKSENKLNDVILPELNFDSTTDVDDYIDQESKTIENEPDNSIGCSSKLQNDRKDQKNLPDLPSDIVENIDPTFIPKNATVLHGSKKMYHVCKLCLKLFVSLDKLTTHLKSHNEVVLPEPNLDTKTDVVEHLDNVPKTQNKVADVSTESTAIIRCTETNSNGKDKDLSKSENLPVDRAPNKQIMHSVLQAKRIYLACKLCLKIFISAEKLFMHLKTHENIKRNLGITKKNTKTVENEPGDTTDKDRSESSGSQKMSPDSDIEKADPEELTSQKEQTPAWRSSKRTYHACKLCFKLFVTAEKLFLHLKTHNNKNDETGTEHLTNDKDIPSSYTCKECNEIFSSSKELTEHSEKHENIELSDLEVEYIDSETETEHEFYSCKLCYKACVSSASLSKHLKKHKKPDKYECHACQQKYSKKSLLAAHIKRTHSVTNSCPCEICGKAFDNIRSLKRHLMIHGTKPFLCDVCGKCFIFKHHLRVHSRTHRVINYDCSVCGEHFTGASEVKEHILLHPRKTGFICRICDCDFSSRKELQLHSMNSHPETERFMCETCGKFFMSRISLKLHSKSHSNVKPFVCTQCGKGYSVKSGLNYHMITHSDVKPFKCKLCNKTFTQNTSLQEHMYRHEGIKPFACEKCNKSFHGKKIYYRHLITHNNLKPYKCDKCDKAFTRKYHLNNHIRNHDKPQKKTNDSQKARKTTKSERK